MAAQRIKVAVRKSGGDHSAKIARYSDGMKIE
jgi:hypothetical protein